MYEKRSDMIENENINDMAKKIKYYRKLKNLTQDELAERSGINISTIKKYECGIRNPKPDQLEKIANALGINMNSFISYDINTTKDVMAYIIKLQRDAGMKISGRKDKSGRYIPGSIKMSFDNSEINSVLAKYLDYIDESPDNINSDSEKMYMDYVYRNGEGEYHIETQ
jgi:transcriptional regulator with XRE-family HTH domain